MSLLAQAGLTLSLGAAGWYAASRLRMPAPTILGPMVVVGTASCLGFVPLQFPSWVKLSLQIIIGIYIGLRLNRAAVASLRSLLWPVALSTLWLLGSALLIGHLLARAGGTDLATAFLATAPGGIAEMSAMAVSLEANVALVATLQALRICATMAVVPFYVRRQAARRPLPAKTARPAAALPEPKGQGKRGHWIACLATGVAGGILLDWVGFPVAGLVGAAVAIAGLQIAGIRFEPPPTDLRTGAQAGLGILIGSTLSPEMVKQLSSQFVPIALTTAATVAGGLILAHFVQGWLHTDAQTALLASAPAGVTQMTAIAEELGAEVFVVSVFQLARLLGTILLVPLGLQLLL